MEIDELLPLNRKLSSSGRGSSRGRGLRAASNDISSSSNKHRLAREGSAASSNGRSPRPAMLTRQDGAHSHDSLWEASDMATAISRDLVARAERWKLLAGDPLPMGSQLPQVNPQLAGGVDKHEVASIYVMDALAGRDSSANIHDRRSLQALKLVRNKAWNRLLNVCTTFHLALPMVEIPRCLPCIGFQRLPDSLDPDSLHEGWRPTTLGSMWVECLLCLLYIYDLWQENRSRLGKVSVRDDGGNAEGGDISTERSAERSASTFFALPPWQVARTCMVALLALGLMGNVFFHYLFEITWHSWHRVILPFLFISRRTYLKHFVAGVVRVLPMMLPVAFLISFVMFFYGFLGYIVYRHEPRVSSILADLDLFGEPGTSTLTFLRIFTARSFMLDVEVIFGGRKDIQLMVLSYAVIMVTFLGALIPAVANRNFKNQSTESYQWVKQQRTLALTRAYMLLKQPDGTVARDDWVRLMGCLRPDCDSDHTSALFGAAQKAEDPMTSLVLEDRRNRLSKAGFFMLCALATANFSQGASELEKLYRARRSAGIWTNIRLRLDALFSWSLPGSSFSLSQQVFNLAVLIQGYQIVREGDDPEDRPAWAYPLGGCLIAYFCLQALLRIIVQGLGSYMMEWRNALGMFLNLAGVAYYWGLWPSGMVYHNVYNILQASRLTVLWNVLHRLGSTTSEVARRLEFVFPAVLRASVALFSVTYSYSVVAYALFCATPMGQGSIDSVKDDSMVQRFAAVKEVANFASMPQTFASMLYITMLSNWPMFMDAAGDVGNAVLARVFFFSFKVILFYIIQPITLGFIVQSYMAVILPGADANRPAFSKPRQVNDSDPLAMSRRSKKHDGAAGREAGAGALQPKSSPKHGSDILKRPDDSGGAYDGSMYGYSTLADGAQKQIDVEGLADDVSKSGDEGEGESEDEDDGSGEDSEGPDLTRDDSTFSDDDITAPVMIASRKRTMSQQFWGLEQAKDVSAAQQGSSIMVARLEAVNAGLMQENCSLKHENDSLRALVESLQPTGTTTAAMVLPLFGEPSATLQRKQSGSSNSIGGMEAIVESDHEEAGGGLV